MTIIRTNTLSLIARQNKLHADSALGVAIERLSSGLRINSAKDDAAGLAIASRFTANINGLNQAARNANDGISMSQTAQGVLDEINNRLQRIRELSVQGLSGTYAGDTGDSIQAEINLNLKEINRLNLWASFNGVPLLDGTAGTKTLQVGAHDMETLGIDLGPPGFSVQELGLLDLTTQGSPNTISHVSTLSGASSKIALDDAVHTTVAYIPPDNNPDLVRPSRGGSRDVVQLGGAGGRLTDVSISSTHDTDTRLNNVRLSVDSSVVVGSTARESVSNWAYLDDNGNAVSLSQPSVVQSGGSYWIQHQYNGSTYYYEAELTIHGDRHRITAQAKSGARVAEADMNGPISQPLNSAPAVNKATAAYSLTLDGADESANTNMELVHLGGYYYVEEQVSPGQYAYYQADVTIATGGAQNTISITSNRSQAITVSDQPFVSGSTTAHLEPANANIKVNYIDLAGNTHTNVMRADEDGGYVFHINEFDGGGGAYKTAKVVQNQNGQYMLQTKNGSAEVVLYYPLYYQNANGTYLSSFDVFTDVDNNTTTITLREADVAQRLRHPIDPLAAIDRAIARVDAKRGELGALDNRLQSVIQSNALTGANLSAARSRIEDADYAIEVSNVTRAQILQQAGASLLTQANQVPQTVLKMLL